MEKNGRLCKISRTTGCICRVAPLLHDEGPGIELKKKLTIGAALGYFILPTDAVPDLTPILGFTDDLGVLIYALSQISSAITDDIRQKARLKMQEWFRTVDDNQLMLLESRISGSDGTSL